MRFRHCVYPLVLTLEFFSWAVPEIAQTRAPFDAVDLDGALPLDTLAAQLSAKRVVFIGEMHDRYDHHVNQLAIIRRLYAGNPDLAIGVEYFQQPFQSQVDDYIAGRTTENEFLRATEYYKRWGYDYRFYAPIFRYARQQHIPVRALNVPGALPSAVSKLGIAGLSKEQRASLPTDIEPADAAYRARLRAAFEEHTTSKPGGFDHFVEAQLVWDEGMAESAASYLNANPNRRMVILAGSGHVAFGAGIPKRLERRTHATYAIVLSSGENIELHMADYILLSEKQELPPAGVLGTSLQDKEDQCRISSLVPGGAAEKAGLEKRDALLSIDGQSIQSIADVHLALWDKKPGDRVRVSVSHNRLFREATRRDFEVLLTAPQKTDGNP
jgi:uncharacterized iron-regulated protein